MTLRTSSSLLLLALLAGCPAEPEPVTDTDAPEDTDPPETAKEARFADASEAELVAAVAVGAGYLPVIAWSSTIPGIVDALASNDTCPASAVNADGTVTYAAIEACVAPSGQTYEGSFTGDNLPDLFSEEEPNDEPMSVTFDGWSAQGLVVDGTVWQSTAAPEGPYTTKADVTVTIDGLPAASLDTELLCDLLDSNESVCTSEEAARMEVAGLGAFTVEGPWRTDATGAPLGQITLVGEDELTLDLDGFDPETGCIPAEVDGVRIDDICIAGLVTGPIEDPPESDVLLMGSVVSAVGETLEVTLWSVGSVAYADAELVVGDSGSELHALEYVGKNGLDEDTWSAFLDDGDYVSGESTALDPFSNLEEIAVKYRAYDEEGQIVACGFGGTLWDANPNDWFAWDDCPGSW